MIKTKGNQVLSVPNDFSGQATIKLIKTGLNADKYIMRIRGRGKNRKANGGDSRFMPIDRAEWLAVYIMPKNGDNEFWSGYESGREAERQNMKRYIDRR